VRDLEFEGDTVLKRLSQDHETDKDTMKKLSLISDAANLRLKIIEQQVAQLWEPPPAKWMLPSRTGPLGKRILLVANPGKFHYR
jgi:hypothetical protein